MDRLLGRAPPAGLQPAPQQSPRHPRLPLLPTAQRSSLVGQRCQRLLHQVNVAGAPPALLPRLLHQPHHAAVLMLYRHAAPAVPARSSGGEGRKWRQQQQWVTELGAEVRSAGAASGLQPFAFDMPCSSFLQQAHRATQLKYHTHRAATAALTCQSGAR